MKRAVIVGGCIAVFGGPLLLLMSLPNTDTQSALHPAQVIKSLEPGIEAKPAEEKVAYLVACLRARQYHKGILAYRRLFREDHPPLSALLTYYSLLMANDEIHLARGVMTKIAQRNPSFRPQLLCDTGLILARQGEGREATVWFKKALDLDPLFLPAFRQLVLCRSRDKDVKHYGARVLALVPEDSVVAREVMYLLLLHKLQWSQHL
jgi:hypothetical protein